MSNTALSQFMKRIVEDRRKTREAMGKIGDESVNIALKSQYGEQEAQNKFKRDFALKEKESQDNLKLEGKKQAGQTYRLFKSLRSKESIAGAKPKVDLTPGYAQFSESLRQLLEDGADNNGIYDTTAYPSLMKSFGDSISEEGLGEALTRYKRTLKQPGDIEDLQTLFGERFPELATGGSMVSGGDQEGPSEEAIAFTMNKYKMTRQQVLDKLNAKKTKP